MLSEAISNIQKGDKQDKASLGKPFINLTIMIICEILIFFNDTYGEYLLYYIFLNGLYFGLIVSKLITSTMTGTAMKYPTLESVFYLITIILGLFFPQFETILYASQWIFIIVYYIYFYSLLISQLMKELKIETF